MKTKPDLLDVVELREPRGGQPAGAISAVVELFSTEPPRRDRRRA
jgi:hypothetical protein